MTDYSLTIHDGEDTLNQESRSRSELSKFSKYILMRLIMLLFTISVGVYLTILIANMGGYVDEIRRGEIRSQISMDVYMSTDAETRQLSSEERQNLVDRMVALEESRLGLDRPFISRSFGFLKSALTLNLGRAQHMYSDSGSKTVKLIILERLPATLTMWGLSNVILFFLALFLALFLSRRYGSFLDKAIITLAPTGAAPGWFYGLFLIIIFASIFRVLPFGGMVDAPPPSEPIGYVLSLLKHLILPVCAILISSVFLNAYNWRTYFLIYSSEDYVEMAKAKGLPERDVERRYILRPTLPTIVTAFALLMITLWTGAIILETTFNWPGLGQALYQAIGLFDSPVIIGSTVIYAYLLALTVFFLDFLYAIIDPRVRVAMDDSS
jgi:peptide/nickel transport system permease protein